jgi:hypothetical protein
MWIIYVLLAIIAFLLFRILRELHAFAFLASFNLSLFRNVAVEKVLTEEEKSRYHEALEKLKEKYPKYF